MLFTFVLELGIKVLGKERWMEIFDPALIQQIETMDHVSALIHCESIIEKTKTKPKKKAALLRDIKAAPNPKELSRIMWNVLLAGEGLATTNSKWQQMYGK